MTLAGLVAAVLGYDPAHPYPEWIGRWAEDVGG